ncbi:hypothetical protein, partial [Thiolapillus sp.]|uniref:hypothetical protein n=1 Tax=Thiolapillus sp. TaxID=2017437 RepID=UPI003AF795B4
SKVSGFVFTRMDEGYKVVNIDLLGNHDLKSFTLLVKAPGLVTDSSQVDFDHLYERWTDIETEEELRRLLAAMPCCTTDRSGEHSGDPLNIVFIGGNYSPLTRIAHRSPGSGVFGRRDVAKIDR